MLKCKANYGDLSDGSVLLGSKSAHLGLTFFRCLQICVRCTHLSGYTAVWCSDWAVPPIAFNWLTLVTYEECASFLIISAVSLSNPFLLDISPTEW
jgi:hypothetical protein